jgi:hypothetical protein
MRLKEGKQSSSGQSEQVGPRPNKSLPQAYIYGMRGKFILLFECSYIKDLLFYVT